MSLHTTFWLGILALAQVSCPLVQVLVPVTVKALRYPSPHGVEPNDALCDLTMIVAGCNLPNLTSSPGASIFGPYSGFSVKVLNSV